MDCKPPSTEAKVLGVHAGDVIIWKGIPFAVQPVGELRMMIMVAPEKK